MKQIFFAVMIAGLAAGCTHTSTLDWEKPLPGQRSSRGNTVLWNMTATNRGMYLFNVIPLWSGRIGSPNQHEYRIFQNTLTRGKMRQMMDKPLKKLEADRVEDVQITTSSSGAFSLWIVWNRTMRATGVAVKVEPDSKKTAITDNK
ncbi:MAG: hypothetical protein J6S43_03695 [Lentisphaeria bacterium]|nr:hypothetical protein [Lentisphaeria bacterium]